MSRTRPEIVLAVLRAVQASGLRGIRKTRIMYSANLNTQNRDEIIAQLVGNGLVRPETQRVKNREWRLYFLTERGNDFLRGAE